MPKATPTAAVLPLICETSSSIMGRMPRGFSSRSKEFTTHASLVDTTGSATAARTCPASSAMNSGSRFSAGARRQCSMPAPSASSRYSMSISSSVSICSETKEMGTTTSLFTPDAAMSRSISSVYGLSHSTGPTRDWNASLKSAPSFWISRVRCVTSATVCSMWRLYGSPACSMYDRGTPWAEKRTVGGGSPGEPGGRAASSAATRRATSLM
mmetsp:Transcript_12436/g.41436  ORF Transcript_12436/g.41436 Transcript_12436/m.41436 type:complete len:212 (+) Transcript_12436:113-748(+)